MKHSKMFKMLLTGVAVVAMAASTFAAVTVPFSDSFESYAEGTDIGTNGSGWYAEADVALATTNNNPTGYYAGYPITNINHNVTMAFDGTVSNSIAGVDTEGVYVDFLVQPTFWDEEDAPAVPANSQVALYFDTNGYANIYHTYEETFSPYLATQKWTQISNVDAIGTQDWVRVTYQMFYDNTDYTYFKLWINGSAVSSSYGYTDDTFLATNGTYFINSDCNGYGSLGATKINSFTAKGAGTLDDFVVTDGSITPFVPAGNQWTVTTSAGTGGSIDPDGATVVDQGDTFSATVTADVNKLIESITTNTIAIALTNSSVQVVEFDVYSDVTVNATFTNAPISTYLIAITNLNETLGTVVPGSDTNVTAGSDLTITITANTGYKSEVSVDGASAVETNEVVFNSVAADHVVLVDFILGNVPSTNGVDVASSWLQAYGLDLTSENADAYWEAFLADINPTNGSFEIISAEVVDGTNYIKWISEGKTSGLGLPPFDVLGTDDLLSGWTSIDTVARPSTFTTNVFEDATKTYYKINASD